MNNFGGNWTENKIDILIEYAKAYLVIMNKYTSKYQNWRLMYFDGFAGSGLILNKQKSDDGQNLLLETEDEIQDIIVGAAKRILSIVEPRSFDEYYFVEKDEVNFLRLEENTKNIFPDKSISLVNEDCNKKMIDLSNFLKSSKGKNFKVLAYIDPCGMQLNWNSIKSLSQESIDMWILIPTGMGVNRLLTNSGEISEAWLKKLEHFLGMEKSLIIDYFYKETQQPNLFGEQSKTVTKKDKAIERSAELYSERLNELFKFVSKPYILRTKSNVILYHFLMVSNNQAAYKIANDIVSKYRID